MPRITGLPVASNVGANDLFVIVQANVTKRATLTQVLANGNVNGNVGNLTVNGVLTVIGNSNLAANANVGNNLTVVGTANLSGNATVGNNLTVGGNQTVGGNVVVTGTITAAGNANLQVNAVVGGNLVVTGNANFTVGGITVPTSGVGTVYSDSYTPTIGACTNVQASSPQVTGYMRVGNFVVVAGMVGIDPTSAALTEFEMTLPIASNISATRDLGGAGGETTSDPAAAVRIVGNVANKTAQFDYRPNTTSNTPVSFTFGYRILP